MIAQGAAPGQKSRFIERLETFRDRLLQVDWRNRSILLKRVQMKWSFDLGGMGPLFGGVAVDAVEKGLAGKGSVGLVLDSDDSDTAEGIRSSLTQLDRSVRLIFEESGQDDCYLGFPFLVGHLAPDKYVRAPVVLFPASLERVRRDRGSGYYLTFSEDDPPVLNRALLSALGKVRGVGAPKGLEDALADILEEPEGSRAEGDAVLGFLVRLHKLLESASVPLGDEPPKASKPVPLDALTVEAIAGLPLTRLHLAAHAVAGSFPQGSTAIYADYETLIERAAGGETNQGIIDDLLEAPDPEPPSEPPAEALRVDGVPDRRLNFALATDGSQDAVLVEAQLADCVVVRGPPGTGKSQVIVNLVTDALARGERALVVCQKRAALDVVFQRLERAGLAEAAVLVHDARADRPEQYKRLAKRMEGPPPPVDGRLERVFEETTKLIDETVAELNGLVAPLWAEVYGGVRPHELYAAAQPGYASRLRLAAPPSTIGVTDLKATVDALPKLEEGWRRFDAPGAPLRGRKPFGAADLPFARAFGDGLAAVRDAAVDDALFVRQPVPQGEFLADVRYFNAAGAKPWRFLLPKWYKSKGAVARFRAARPADARAGDTKRLQAALEAGSRLEAAVQGLDRWMREEGWTAVGGALQDPKEVRARVDAVRAGLASFEAIVEHDRRVAALSPTSASLYASAAAALGATSEPWAPVVKQEVYLAWIEAFEAGHGQMGGEPFARYLELRERLGRLMEDRRQCFVDMLSADLGRRARTPAFPAGDHHPNKRPETDWRGLAHEFQKQRRLKTVRRLIDDFPFPFAQVAPCWLASPEAVSDIFPLERGLFDIVIFDEASQLAVERALPAIYRGKRTVIAGDEKQLRPFDLFQMRGDGDDGGGEDGGDEDSVVQAESLLVLAMRIFTPRYLSWHYRSKYQELIDFSNHAFYDGNLQIAANVERSGGLPPIEFVRVAGQWEDRTNKVEADEVVGLLKNLLAAGAAGPSPAPSLGVITFNDQQRSLIQDAVEARRASDSEFDRLWSAATAADRLLDDRPFVKNLENVQGDERDIILFSVGYAPGKDGKLRVQFGSLSLEGGENRLNVAITRARQKIIMVASFDPKSLPTEGTKNVGPQRLKQYLVYAEAVSKLRKDAVAALLNELDPGAASPPAQSQGLVFEKPFELQLKEALEAVGLKVDARVGFSAYRVDLAVADEADPGRYVLALECDGATFHSARSARERDVERQRFLEAHGWVVERAWSRSWWRGREAEVGRIAARVAGERAKRAVPAGPPPKAEASQAR